MSELKKSKQLAKIVAVDGLETGIQRIVIRYDRLDQPKLGQSAGNLKKNIDEATANKVKALKVGDEVVIEKTQTDDGKFWNLTGIADKSTFVPREKKEWVKGSGGFQKSSYDSLGPVIGMLFNNAVLIAIKNIRQDDNNYILDKAKELLVLNREFDAYVRRVLEDKNNDDIKVGAMMVDKVKQVEKEFNDDWSPSADDEVENFFE